MDGDIALQDYAPLTTPADRQLLHAGAHWARRVLEFKDLIQGFDATMKYLPPHLSEQEARADLIIVAKTEVHRPVQKLMI
jgi:hypothetical protein